MLFSVRHPNPDPINTNTNPSPNPNHNNNPGIGGRKLAWSGSSCPYLGTVNIIYVSAASMRLVSLVSADGAERNVITDNVMGPPPFLESPPPSWMTGLLPPTSSSHDVWSSSSSSSFGSADSLSPASLAQVGCSRAESSL